MLYQNISYLQFRVLSPINSKIAVWATRSCCCCCCPLSLPYDGNGILSTTSSPHNLFTTFISLHQNTGTVWSATDLIIAHIETASAAKACGLKFAHGYSMYVYLSFSPVSILNCQRDAQDLSRPFAMQWNDIHVTYDTDRLLLVKFLMNVETATAFAFTITDTGRTLDKTHPK